MIATSQSQNTLGIRWYMRVFVKWHHPLCRTCLYKHLVLLRLLLPTMQCRAKRAKQCKTQRDKQREAVWFKEGGIYSRCEKIAYRVKEKEKERNRRWEHQQSSYNPAIYTHIHIYTSSVAHTELCAVSIP